MKFFDSAKGYGYILADSGEEYLFNKNSFRGAAPQKGDRVEFQAEHGPKSMMAKRMQVTASV